MLADYPAKHGMGDGSKLNGDLGQLLGQPFPGGDIEGDSLPSPIIQEYLQQIQL